MKTKIAGAFENLMCATGNVIQNDVEFLMHTYIVDAPTEIGQSVAVEPIDKGLNLVII